MQFQGKAKIMRAILNSNPGGVIDFVLKHVQVVLWTLIQYQDTSCEMFFLLLTFLKLLKTIPNGYFPQELKLTHSINTAKNYVYLKWQLYNEK